jgi:hypothetical protein
MRASRLIHLLPVFGAVIVAQPVSAQREQLSLRVEQFGESDVLSRVGLPDRASFDLRQTTLTAAHRSILGTDGNTVLVNGVFYRRSDLGGELGDQTLHALYYDFLALRTLNDRHTLAVAVRPGLFGNLDEELGQQFRVEGAVFVDRIITPRTTIGLGASYTSNFGRVIPVPVLHIVHRRGRKVLIDGLLPSRLDIWYFPRKGVELGLNTQLSGFQYYVGAELRPQPAVPPPGAAVSFRTPEIQLANATIGPQLRWNAFEKWYLSADAGATVLRRYTFGLGSREFALEPSNAWFARVGLQRMF